jgi:hypothetical protein
MRERRDAASFGHVDHHTRYDDDRAAQAFVEAHPDGAAYADVGHALGVSQECVRQVEYFALRKMAARLARLGLGADAVSDRDADGAWVYAVSEAW